MREVFENRYGELQLLLADQDTAYLKEFQSFLNNLRIERFHDKTVNKISQVERYGGLVKRFVAALAKKEGKQWHDVLQEAQNTWNSSYSPPFGLPHPKDTSEKNFDKVVQLLWKNDPMRFHSMYPVGHSITERQANELFAFRRDQQVLASLKTVHKRMRKALSAKYYSELRNPSWAEGTIVARTFGFVKEKKGLVKKYMVKLKNGPKVTLYEDEMRAAKRHL